MPQSVDEENATVTTFVPDSHHGTINASAADPNKLECMTLFHDANPRWESDGIIFVKSNLRILPGGERFENDGQVQAFASNRAATNPAGVRQAIETGADVDVDEPAVKEQYIGAQKEPGGGGETRMVAAKIGKVAADSTKADQRNDDAPTEDRPRDPRPADGSTPEDNEHSSGPASETIYTPDLSLYDVGGIAVFEQSSKWQSGPFRFAGCYKIARLEYLAPHSAALCRMLDQKFSTVDSLRPCEAALSKCRVLGDQYEPKMGGVQDGGR
ncbi:unnamed protein product [Discula destructiva]